MAARTTPAGSTVVEEGQEGGERRETGKRVEEREEQEQEELIKRKWKGNVSRKWGNASKSEKERDGERHTQRERQVKS